MKDVSQYYDSLTMDGRKLAAAFCKFDAANDQDPRKITVDGEEQSHETWYARRLTDWVMRLDPDPSESLLLASRCQHICRWQIPRSNYPEGRAGYLKWREELKKFHAEKAEEILREVGYDDETLAQVRELNLKKNLKNNPDCQTLEDSLCLIFLIHQFDALIMSTDEEKMIKIVQKTWAKMSERGQQEALKLSYSSQAKDMIEKALAAPH
ncbi:hypothetical protein Rhal01_00937 [Rubritalea halochordaticola]|uniref:DUF4202 domain-containing protein n=1 Tax=Rubritalea halochordaticola TaxID=714537 RepID=A0ABP9UX22_9BACT